jgi:hypothetical protein
MNILHFKYSSSSSDRSLQKRSFGNKRPNGYWEQKENQRLFLDQLAIKWNIQKPEDWKKFTTTSLLKEGGRFVGHYYGSLANGKS